ncbi:hypothetical protein BDF19DRAFT_446213 [Syncephalis fuscata]|nr:hypothetical protein BDF19DRAFT_446213 [Syncephalis fuscata]
MLLRVLYIHTTVYLAFPLFITTTITIITVTLLLLRLSISRLSQSIAISCNYQVAIATVAIVHWVSLYLYIHAP